MSVIQGLCATKSSFHCILWNRNRSFSDLTNPKPKFVCLQSYASPQRTVSTNLCSSISEFKPSSLLLAMLTLTLSHNFLQYWYSLILSLCNSFAHHSLSQLSRGHSISWMFEFHTNTRVLFQCTGWIWNGGLAPQRHQSVGHFKKVTLKIYYPICRAHIYCSLSVV